MNTHASKTLIGGFVVGAVVLIVTGILIFGSGKLLKKTSRFVLLFKGSLQGLNVGNAVLFRGVKIGSVESITIEANAKSLAVSIPVIIQIEPGLVKMIHERRKIDIGASLPQLIKQGLRAKLTMGSIVTGQLMIGLGFYPDTPVEMAGQDTEYPEIPTISSAFERISDVVEQLPLEKIINKILSAFGAIEVLMKSPDIPDTLHSLKLTVDDARKMVNNLDSRIGLLAASIDETARAYSKLARDVDSHVKPLASSMDSTLKDTRKMVRAVDSRTETLTHSMEKSLEKAREALEQGRKALNAARETIGKDSPVIYQFDKTLKEISAMARSIRSLADYLERHPDALLYGKGKPTRR